MRASVHPPFVFINDEAPDPMLGDTESQTISVRRDDDGDAHPITLLLGDVHVHLSDASARAIAEMLAKAAAEPSFVGGGT